MVNYWVRVNKQRTFKCIYTELHFFMVLQEMDLFAAMEATEEKMFAVRGAYQPLESRLICWQSPHCSLGLVRTEHGRSMTVGNAINTLGLDLTTTYLAETIKKKHCKF